MQFGRNPRSFKYNLVCVLQRITAVFLYSDIKLLKGDFFFQLRERKISRKMVVDYFLSDFWLILAREVKCLWKFITLRDFIGDHTCNREYAWTFEEALHLFSSNDHNGRCVWQPRRGIICIEWQIFHLF